MSFWGQYGNLSTIEAATQMLIDISKEIKPEDLKDWDNPNVESGLRYDSLRAVREIEGLQRVLWLNKAPYPHTWLPILFDHTKERNR